MGITLSRLAPKMPAPAKAIPLPRTPKESGGPLGRPEPFSFLSDPRAPSTSMPESRFKVNIAARHATLYKRPPDRGAATPVLGIRQLVDGMPGGVPNPPRPALEGIPRPILRASVGQGQRLANSTRIAAAIKRIQSRPIKARAALGTLSALDIAKAPRLIPDLRTGTVIRRGARHDVRGANRLRGLFAEHTKAPRSVLGKLVRERAVERPEINPLTAKRGVGALPVDVDMLAQAGAPTMAPDVVKAEIAASDKGMERVAFLGAMVFVAWLIFRNR